MKLISFLTALILTQIVYSQTVIINEVSQGNSGTICPSGSCEYVEFVVVGQKTCSDSCLDMRHMIIDDNNGLFASGSGFGIAQGAMRFSNSNFWKCIPYGTIILIYNSASPNILVPADDYSLLDNSTLIIPSNSNLLEWTSLTPTTTLQSYPLPSNFWGNPTTSSWTNSLSMANAGDSFQVRDSNGVLLHSVSWGSNSSNTIIYFSGGAGGKVFSFINGTSNNSNLVTNWQSGQVGVNETPGLPNSPGNNTWISQMTISPTLPTLGSINHN